MEDKLSEIHGGVKKYYSAKLGEYGETPRGVDWNGESSQTLRFDQVCKIIDLPSGFSINDLGCGYGALLDYLSPRYSKVYYEGYDIASGMIHAAQNRFAKMEHVSFVVSHEPRGIADFSMASGIFNVRLDWSDSVWWDYVGTTLEVMNRSSRRGFSFNCLSSYSDPDKRKDYLFYADPRVLFDQCQRRFSRHVALLHDYGLFEFTLLVRKNI